MMMNETNKVLIKILNQFFELQRKTLGKPELQGIQRNIERINELFGELGLIIYNPIGESYNEMRTDCEANIAGNLSDKLIISEVIKPIIYFCDNVNCKSIVQRGIVVVESV